MHVLVVEEAEGEEERESQADSVLSMEANAGLDPWSPGSVPGLKAALNR